MKRAPVSWRLRFRWLLVLLRLICVGLLIVAIARPRKGTVLSNIATEGVAMEIVVDRSGSMGQQMQYKGKTMTRYDAVKLVLKDFVGGGGELAGRDNDLIGLITFALYADTTCPLVHGHNVLLEFLKQTDIVKIGAENWTSIGDAVALAAARLKKAEEEINARNARLSAIASDDRKSQQDSFTIKSKVIILLTDGVSNSGKYKPLEAAKLAKEWGIKIYTIGIGSDQSFTTVQSLLGAFQMPSRQQLDEGLLKAMAQQTGGFYAKGSSGEDLEDIYAKIDQLEKSEVRSLQYTEYAEKFTSWALGALAVLAIEILARCTIFRKIP